MQRLGLDFKSKELNNIMHNKYLLSHYTRMIAEDYEQDFNMFKYLGLLNNPEGFKELERFVNPKGTIEMYERAQPYASGKEADEKMVKPIKPEKYREEENDGIELG